MERKPQRYRNGELVVVIDCADLERSAGFWGVVLGFNEFCMLQPPGRRRTLARGRAGRDAGDMNGTSSAGAVLDTTVGGVLRDAAERAAETIALVEGTPDRASRRRWSYADLLADAERVARALLGRFAPGERVAVWAPNSPEWLLMEFGAALAGLTLVTVNPALRAGEVKHVLGQSRAQGVVLAPAFRGADLTQTLAQIRGDLPGLREVISLADWAAFAGSGSPAERLPEVGPDDAAQIQYTSGTTGFPKGAVLRHRGITNNARFNAEILQAGPGDVWVNPMPLFHTAGCVCMTLGPVQGLFTQVVVPGFDPGLVLRLTESEGSDMHAPEGIEYPDQPQVPDYKIPVYNEDGRHRVDYVEGQDMMAWVTQGPITDRTVEHLGRSDVGVTMLRRMFKENMAAVARGDDPLGVIRSPHDRIDLPCEKNKFDAGVSFAIDFIDKASSRFSPQADALKKLHIKAQENRKAAEG